MATQQHAIDALWGSLIVSAILMTPGTWAALAGSTLALALCASFAVRRGSRSPRHRRGLGRINSRIGVLTSAALCWRSHKHAAPRQKLALSVNNGGSPRHAHRAATVNSIWHISTAKAPSMVKAYAVGVAHMRARARLAPASSAA